MPTSQRKKQSISPWALSQKVESVLNPTVAVEDEGVEGDERYVRVGVVQLLKAGLRVPIRSEMTGDAFALLQRVSDLPTAHTVARSKYNGVGMYQSQPKCWSQFWS